MLNNIFGFTGPTITIGSYAFTFSVASILEIILFAIIVYYLIRWIRRTNSWMLLKGVAILVGVYVLALLLGLNNLTYLFKTLFSSLVLAFIIIFQSEIRDGLKHLGSNNVIQKFLPIIHQEEDSTALNSSSIKSIAHALASMGQNRVGALIVIERKVNLDSVSATGIILDAKICTSLLEQIFEHNTPLHDGAVVIQKNRIAAATCYLPLSKKENISKNLGTRHRAAIGITEESDCIALVASEETGKLSICMNGEIRHGVSEDDISKILTQMRVESLEDRAANKAKKEESGEVAQLFKKEEKTREQKPETKELEGEK